MNVIDIINNIDNDLKALIINVLGGVITTILIFAVGKFFKLVPQIMKQTKSWFLLLLVNIFLFFMIFINDNLTKTIVAITVIILLEVTSLFWVGKKEKEISSLKNRELPKDARYFIGIDVGRSTINYCLVDYEKFGTNDDGIVCDQNGNRISGVKDTPNDFGEIFETLSTIIFDILDKNIQISGIGIGLPGQVEPKEGKLTKFPGYIQRGNIKFVRNIKDELERIQDINFQKKLKNVDIKIDNDARCATRYIWKKKNENNFACLLIGNGLGSGIVLNNNIIYGHNFMAGEIGHTTISRFFLESKDKHENKPKCYTVCGCMSDKENIPNQCHLEMYVSDYGMINIAKNLDNDIYNNIKRDYDNIIKTHEFQDLLTEQKIDENKLKKDNELTTYFFSIAFRIKHFHKENKINEYPKRVVKKFIEYMGIGLANYSNILDLEKIYLAGGMIDGFFSKKCIVDVTGTCDLLGDCWSKHIIGSNEIPITLEEQQREIVASVGAALIFQDQSYFNYIGKE